MVLFVIRTISDTILKRNQLRVEKADEVVSRLDGCGSDWMVAEATETFGKLQGRVQ